MSRSIVWILGAGFSQPLGAPILGGIFKQGIVAKVFNVLKAADRRTDADAMRSIGNALSECYKQGAESWRDEEEFLEAIDRAAEHDGWQRASVARCAKGLGADGERFEALTHAARRYVACATHFFVEPAEAVSARERWNAYRTWAGRLGSQDHVITFNYDLVAERAAASAGSKLQRFIPGTEGKDVPHYSPLPAGPRLLKMHGSVDWVDDGDSLRAIDDPWGNLGADDERFALAIPGPAKASATATIHSETWKAACAAIQRADEINFVGYRLPETDAIARDRLLGSIKIACARENRPPPRIRIVLGPRRDEHVERLRGLFAHAVPRAPIDPVPLWSQDFLAVFEPQH